MDFKVKPKKFIFTAIIASMLCSFLAGCEKEEVTNDNLSDAKPEEYIADWLDIQNEDNKEFYIMRVNDDYLEVPGTCQWVYDSDGGEYPELENGQIAKVKADVAIYNGGIAGYTGNSFIRKLKDSEIVGYDSFINDCNVGELYTDDINYNNRILKYQENDDVYLIVLNRRYIDVYKNGEAFLEYDQTEYDDILEPLKTVLDDNGGIEDTGVIEGFEYEILEGNYYDTDISERGYVVDNTEDASDAKCYYTVSAGEKSTGGFGIYIKDIMVQNEGSVIVVVEETKPAPDEMVTAALTYPNCTFSINPCPEKIFIVDEEDNMYEMIDR